MPRIFFSSIGLLLGALSVSACGAGVKKQAPGVAPAPETVTREKPGGNADDPQEAALKRQYEAPWGWRTDKDHQARFPLPDPRNWTRVRFSLIDHFTGFRYGKKHHSIAAAFVVSLKPSDPRTSAACIERFEESGLPLVRDFGGEVSELKTKMREWNHQPLVVRRATGKVSIFFRHYDAALAWTGYPAYPDKCMIYAVVVPWEGQQKLAEKVRNRWIDAFDQFRPLTQDAPFRYE